MQQGGDGSASSMSSDEMEQMIEARLREVELRHVGSKNMKKRICGTDSPFLTHMHTRNFFGRNISDIVFTCWQRKIVKN